MGVLRIARIEKFLFLVSIFSGTTSKHIDVTFVLFSHRLKRCPLGSEYLSDKVELKVKTSLDVGTSMVMVAKALPLDDGNSG